MSVEISLENELFIQQVIDNETYHNRAEVLAEAMDSQGAHRIDRTHRQRHLTA